MVVPTHMVQGPFCFAARGVVSIDGTYYDLKPGETPTQARSRVAREMRQCRTPVATELRQTRTAPPTQANPDGDKLAALRRLESTVAELKRCAPQADKLRQLHVERESLRAKLHAANRRGGVRFGSGAFRAFTRAGNRSA